MLPVIGILQNICAGLIVQNSLNNRTVFSVVHHAADFFVHPGKNDGCKKGVQTAKDQGADDDADHDFYTDINISFTGFVPYCFFYVCHPSTPFSNLFPFWGSMSSPDGLAQVPE